MRKFAQGKVDEFRTHLHPDRDAEFIRIANQPNQNITVLHRWLLDEGYRGSYQSVCNWYGSFKRSGEKAQRFNDMAQTFTGVIPDLALQKIMVTFGNLLDDYLDQVAIAEPGTIEPSEYLRVIPHIAREVRSCAGVIHQLKYMSDRKSAEQAGAYRLHQELLLVFTDTPFEAALTEALKSAMTRIETEAA